MIRATLYFPRIKWTVYAYIAVHEYYTYEILDKMRSIGASTDELRRAHKNLMDGNLNGGITKTNYDTHESVWVFELTTSAREFFNSVVHEIRHLQQHIANVLGLDENSEDVCYLSGDIAYALFPYIQKLLCEHCRKHI